MKILVFELACATGGFESSVLYEGFEMLNMIAGGFMRAGHEVTVILNSSIFKNFKSRLEERVDKAGLEDVGRYSRNSPAPTSASTQKTVDNRKSPKIIVAPI